MGHIESDTQEWNTHGVELGTHGGRDTRREGHTRSGTHTEWTTYGMEYTKSEIHKMGYTGWDTHWGHTHTE